MDAHWFGCLELNPDPDPHSGKKLDQDLDPDPHGTYADSQH